MSMIACPPHIKDAHWQEWVFDSQVSPELTSLNLHSLEGTAPYDYLLYGLDTSERRNDGRLRDSWLERYAHTEAGGWWCSGINILTGEEESWGCFKPDNPRSESRKPKGFDPHPQIRLIKYEHPPKTVTSIFALQVPDSIWDKIAQRYGIKRYHSSLSLRLQDRRQPLTFWEWVLKHPEIPVIVTEGAKKAGALLTAGYVAIALPGIWGGYRQSKDKFGTRIGLPYLIPQLEAFCQQGREISFAFDHDSKPKTVENVRKAIRETAKLLIRKNIEVSVITWNSPEKGVDDLIVARGVDCFEALYQARLSLELFEIQSLIDLSPFVSLSIAERYLDSSLIPPDEAQIIGIKAPKGTGKTEWLSKQVEKAIASGIRALVITHRIQLAKALCNRFGIDHIEEIKNSETAGILGYGLCIDSLHSHSQAQFNPEDWQGALIILDEAEQVIWHALNSTTCQNNRVTILNSFQLLLQTAISTGGKIYLSDADLSPIALEYIQKLLGFSAQTWIVENTYNPNQGKRTLTPYDNPEVLVAQLVDALKHGERVLVHTSAQKASSRWGTQSLERLIKAKFPHLKVLRIDAETVADPSHPAMGCMGNLNAILEGYEVVIASPTLETGVSIDLKGHFHSVWCIAQGIQTVDSVCQALERLRDDVPRHIFVKPYSSSRIGNGSTNIQSLLRSQHQLTKANMNLLTQADFGGLDPDFQPQSLLAWARRACVINAQARCYRDSVLEKLASEGYRIIEFAIEENKGESPGQIKEEITKLSDQMYEEYCEKVARASMPNLSELEELENKRAKTEAERHRERKGKLARRYGTEKVTPELVKRDDDGLYPKLRLHYYLTVGKIFLKQRDSLSLSHLAENGKVFQPDLNQRLLSVKVRALEIIEIQQFLDISAEFTSDSLQEWFEKVILLRHDIKTILGMGINPERDTAIGVAQRLLGLLGLRLEFIGKRGARGHQQRVYRGANLDPDGRGEIFSSWLERDRGIALDERIVTPSNINITRKDDYYSVS